MLGSSSAYYRQRVNPWFGVQQWTWLNLLVFLPLNQLSWKKFHLNCVFNFQRICSLYFCTKNTRKSTDIGLCKQAPASRIEAFLYMFSSFSWSKKVLQVKKMLNHNLNSRIFPPWTTFSTQSFHGKVCCCRLFRRQCLRYLLWQWFCPNFQANSLYKSKDT